MNLAPNLGLVCEVVTVCPSIFYIYTVYTLVVYILGRLTCLISDSPIGSAREEVLAERN